VELTARVPLVRGQTPVSALTASAARCRPVEMLTANVATTVNVRLGGASVEWGSASRSGGRWI